MKKKLFGVFLICLAIILFAGCAISIAVAIPALNLDFVIEAIPLGAISSVRTELPGEVTANMHWNDVDTQGRRLRNLHLNMEVSLTSETTLDFTDFDFELYMKEQTADTEFLFNAGTISPATDTYNWTLDKNNSPAVNQLLNFINEHKETDLIFTFRHNYGADGQAHPGTSYEDIEIKIEVTGTAEVVII
jgi:hypothetical protein